MPAYLTILDRDLRIVEANSRFRRDFGDFEGRYCFQVNQHRSERCEHCPAERTFRDGLRHGVEEKFINNMGHEIFLLINTTPITNEAGEITHVMKMATDITELKAPAESIAGQPGTIPQTFRRGALLHLHSGFRPQDRRCESAAPGGFRGLAGRQMPSNLHAPDGGLRSLHRETNV